MRREKLTALLLAVLLLVSAGCSSSGLKDRETEYFCYLLGTASLAVPFLSIDINIIILPFPESHQ